MTRPSISLTDLAEKGSDIDVLRPMIQYVAQRRGERGLQFASGHADGHGAGRATEPAIHARRRAGDAALDGPR